MVNRLELARSYVQELLQTRQDIVAAWVVGSAARGEATEASDFDLVLMVAADMEGKIIRAGVDTWRDGVYIEAGLTSQQEYFDLDTILNSTPKSTHLNDAVIIHDPTGFATRMQNAVRSVFMEPRWVNKRVAWTVDVARDTLATFRTGVTAGIRWRSVRGYLTLPCSIYRSRLLLRGITPSSTRGPLQLAAMAPDMMAHVFDLEGSSGLNLEQVLALEPLVREAVLLAGTDAGYLFQYFANKATWLTHEGLHRESFHVMSMVIGGAAGNAMQAESTDLRAAMEDLAERWCRRVGLTGADTLAARLQLAEALLSDIAACVSPS